MKPLNWRTMDFPLLDLELARRIELAEARAAVDGAEALAHVRQGCGAAVEQIAGGFAVYCGSDSPLTQAVGLGLNGPVSQEEFDRLEAFYRNRNEPVRVETCPLADASLIEQYGKRGYRVTEFSNVMGFPLTAAEKQAAPPKEIAIQLALSDEKDLWTQTVAQGFAEHFPVTEELLEVMRLFAMGKQTECYFARVEGKIAGGGTLALRDGIAGLFGASTLPNFRRRGVQTALLQTRLGRAAEAGCDLAVCIALPGSSSQRNITRQGFRTLYTRVKFEKGFNRDEGAK